MKAKKVVHCPGEGVVSVGAERQEKLQAGQVPQLQARPQRVPDHVHCPQDRQDGKVHERPRGGLQIDK